MAYIFATNDYFVDASKADDTGDGLTEATAKKTLAAVINLPPPAGSTIFLSGGTHTSALGVRLDIPDGVNLVGGGPSVTTVTGDADNPNNEFIRINGKNKFEGINFVVDSGGNGYLLSTLSVGVTCDLTVEDCEFSGPDEKIVLNTPTSGRHNLVFRRCRFNLADKRMIELGSVAVDLQLEDCIGVGNHVLVYSAVTTNDQTISLKNVVIQNIAGTLTPFSLGTTGTGDVSIALKDCEFHLGTNKAIISTESSTGTVSIFDNGGNNLVNSNVDFTGGGTWITPLLEKDLLQRGTSDTLGSTSTLQHILAFDFFKYHGCFVKFIGGTLDGLIRRIEINTQDLLSFNSTVTIPVPVGQRYEVYAAKSGTVLADMGAGVWNVGTASFNSATTFGKLVQDTDVATKRLDSGTATAGSLTTITIGNVPGADDFYKDCLVVLTGGAGVGQARYIKIHVNATKIITFDKPLKIAADATTTYEIYGDVSSDALIAPAVWDELEAGHTTAGTFGDFQREQASRIQVLSSEFVDTGGALTADLGDSGLNANDDYYVGCLIVFTSGPGAGQARYIEKYTVSNSRVSWTQPLGVSTNASTGYKIYRVIGGDTQDLATIKSPGILLEAATNSLAAPSTTTIKLTTGSSVNDFYKGLLIEFTVGTGIGQSSWITTYNGTTKVATIEDVATAIDATTGFRIFANRSSGGSGGSGGGGGAPVRGRMDYVGFLDNRVLDVIVGEEQQLTVILETDGAFQLPVTVNSIKAVDTVGTVVVIGDVNITRVVEDSQVYVLRFTLATTDTAQFVAGLLDLEVSVDNAKSQILGALNLIASLS